MLLKKPKKRKKKKKEKEKKEVLAWHGAVRCAWQLPPQVSTLKVRKSVES
jgi:phage-related protein